jgi:hypothetical protein
MQRRPSISSDARRVTEFSPEGLRLAELIASIAWLQELIEALDEETLATLSDTRCREIAEDLHDLAYLIGHK